MSMHPMMGCVRRPRAPIFGLSATESASRSLTVSPLAAFIRGDGVRATVFVSAGGAVKPRDAHASASDMTAREKGQRWNE